MLWESPSILFFLWIVPLVGALALIAHSRRLRAVEQFVDPPMRAAVIPPTSLTRTWVRAVLMMTGVALLIIALARPRFGVYIDEVTSRGADVYVLLDVSRSMLAEDVAPNRLERAKSDIRDLLSRLEGDRVGLIVFAGAAVELIPLTTDLGFFQLVLEQVDPNSAPRGGSLIGDAIRKAVDALADERERDRAVVLITDGEDHDSFPAEAAQAAADADIRIITVGLGDTGEGARIPRRDDTEQLSFLRYEGQEVWSRMDEELLEEIALTTQGAYVPARTRAYDLGQIYDEQLAQLTRGELRSEKQKRFREQYQLFAALGLLALLAEQLVSRFVTSGAPGVSGAEWQETVSR